MFWPADIIIDAFIDRLVCEHRQYYPGAPGTHGEAIQRVARLSLSRIARSNALYHDLDHTLLVTMVGQDMLRGRIARSADVSSKDWIHFVASLLLFAVGFVRGACPGDRYDRFVIDDMGDTVALPRGKTDGSFWPYYTERSKLFIAHHLAHDAVLSWERVAANVEYSRFPPVLSMHPEIDTYPGLLRAAHLIGAVGDPNFFQKVKPLHLELAESGMLYAIGYKTVAEFQENFADFYRHTIEPLIGEAVALLEYTPQGRVWLTYVHAHVLRRQAETA
jgi:hypothetical protein